VKVIFSYWYWQ